VRRIVVGLVVASLALVTALATGVGTAVAANGNGAGVKSVGPNYNHGKKLGLLKSENEPPHRVPKNVARVGDVRTMLGLDDFNNGIYLKNYTLRGIGKHIEVWVANNLAFPGNDCRNALGLTLREYEGGMSTLCAGCGNDSITAAIVQAFFELDIPPHSVAKMSGIGCSSKTPAYFLGASHGFNAVHGRMPSVATGASAANRELHLFGVSGDGDSLSIGLGQFMHALRRNLDLVYIIENYGVYGLTKGQFSASADVGSKSKRVEVYKQPPIDPVQFALALCGATREQEQNHERREHLCHG
jgi:hypothetical protein